MKLQTCLKPKELLVIHLISVFVMTHVGIYAQNQSAMPVMKVTIQDGKVVKSSDLSSIKSARPVIQQGIKNTIASQDLGIFKPALAVNMAKDTVLPAECQPAELKFDQNKLVQKIKGLPRQIHSPSSVGWNIIESQNFETEFPKTGWSVFSNHSYLNKYWGRANCLSCEGSWSVWCGASGEANITPCSDQYMDNQETWMYFGPFDLRGANAGDLKFYLYNISESYYDYFYYLVSIDGYNFYGSKLSGNTGACVQSTIDFTNVPSLGNICGECPVYMALVFISDNSAHSYPGAYIDNLVIRKYMPSLPDLTGNTLVYSSKYWNAGDTITAEFWEENAGTVSAGSHKTNLYLTTNKIINTSDIYLGQFSFNSIAAGDYQIRSLDFIVPSVTDGTYYVYALVDVNNEVTESNESNNVGEAVSVDIGGNALIDIFIDSLTSIQFKDKLDTQTFLIASSGRTNLIWQISNSNVSWVSVLPASDTLIDLNTEEVKVIFNSNGLDFGSYNTALNLTSNSGEKSHIYIPVQMIVCSSLDADIYITPDSLTIAQSSSAINASHALTGNKPLAKYIPPVAESLVVSRFNDNTGKQMMVINVPGSPPLNYRAPVAVPTANAVILNSVPAFDWSFGCSTTSAAMIAGYYDNKGYPNIYTGPTNGGVMPMTNASWGSVNINGELRKQCPLSATRMGVDGRLTRGHVDDYWVGYHSNDKDPYLQNGWTQHSYGDCTGDYMKSNQSSYLLMDGATNFNFYIDGSKYVGNAIDDGGFGLELFFESRGYTVVSRYNQCILGYNGNTTGFTFDQYVAEINAGRPVMIQVEGRTMVGFGYDLSGNTIYLYDTWDYSIHSMTWGDAYYGMNQYGVSVFQLAPINSSHTFTISNKGGEKLNVSSITSNKSWISISGIPPAPFSIKPSDSLGVTLNINWPSVSCSIGQGTVTIVSDDADKSSVDVKVTAIPTFLSQSIPTLGAITQPSCDTATGSAVINGLPATGNWTLTKYPGGISYQGTGITTRISKLAAGKYTFTVTTPGGCISAETDTLTVDAYASTPVTPAIDEITQPTCTVATGSIAISNLPPSGSWTLKMTPGETTIEGSGTSILVEGLASDIYTFNVTNSLGCVSDVSNTALINAQPETPAAPTVGTITQPTCSVATGSAVLNDLPASGTWTLTRTPGGATTSGSGTSTTISGLATGTYNYSITNAAGCTSATSADVVINSQPEKPAIPFITESNKILHSDAVSGNQWYNQDGWIDDATNQNYTVEATGDYYDIVTFGECSSEKSNTIHVIIVTVELTENNKLIKVYPNPVSNALTIEIIGNTVKTNFNILNSLGQVVYTGDLIDKVVVETSSFTLGVYLIKFEFGDRYSSKIIIKE
jgi:hypothetical protein